MKTNLPSNVRNRKLETPEADEYGFPANGDWSALEAQAHQDMAKSKDDIEKGRTASIYNLKDKADDSDEYFSPKR